MGSHGIATGRFRRNQKGFRSLSGCLRTISEGLVWIKRDFRSVSGGLRGLQQGLRGLKRF